MNYSSSPSAVIPFSFNDHLIRTTIIDDRSMVCCQGCMCDVLGVHEVVGR